MLVSKDDIKRATLEYCTENLKNNKPDIEVKEAVARRKTEQLNKISDKSGEIFEVTKDKFEQILNI